MTACGFLLVLVADADPGLHTSTTTFYASAGGGTHQEQRWAVLLLHRQKKSAIIPAGQRANPVEFDPYGSYQKIRFHLLKLLPVQVNGLELDLDIAVFALLVVITGIGRNGIDTQVGGASTSSVSAVVACSAGCDVELELSSEWELPSVFSHCLPVHVAVTTFLFL
jgi:hypothetical protein